MSQSIPSPAATHEVFNQPPPLVDYNLFASDRALQEAVRREGADWAISDLTELGGKLGRQETIENGFAANTNPPQLRAFDRYGNRRDEVVFHPAYHEMLGLAVAAGLHSSPWAKPGPGAHVARAAGFYMLTQIESGVCCPIAMTYGSVPTLRRNAALAAEWLPRIFSRRYDRAFRPAAEKSGALFGMGMTEKQGGSDLRANTTRAIPSGEGDGIHRITGHKWFMSAPMCDAFLVLAQAPKGPSCFLVPRWTPDGAQNGLRLQRLKDKLGNRSNASSEVEFVEAWGALVGEEGRGIPIIIEMGNLTRLDCAIGSAGLMRQAIAQAVHHAKHRTAFQKHLVDQPLMANVLADLALEAEAAAVLVLRLARAYDGDDAAFRRLITPIAKYWICKRGPALAVEALEALGGNGYVEESIMPRLYREMPVNSVWEGSANIICLDVRRAMTREPGAIDAFLAEISRARGGNVRLDRYLTALEAELRAAGQEPESLARRMVGRMAVALEASLLVQHAPPAVADAFCASRLENDAGGAFGTLPQGIDTDAIVERAAPQ
ncbi:MAG TPA: isovaleryl-CoA dehydrogenase [Stellaceae bacterium]|nr:isovaleryl-CoA dehydrogenase [Stellaceae bacterium]